MPTTVVNPTKWAFMGSLSSGTFSTARQTGFSVSNNPSGDINTAIRYSAASGRGSLTHAFNRTFYYFDLSSTPDLTNLTTASLEINGYVNADARVIIVSSSAFGGDGSSNATTGEFFTSLDYNQPYTTTTGTQWTTGANTLELNTSHVLTYLKSNPDAFILALIDRTNDYTNTASTVAVSNREGIKFSDHASGVELSLVTPATSDIDNINGVAYNANVRFNSILLSDITSINGVT